MKRLIQFMAVAALMAIQGCSFDEIKVKPDLPQEDAFKVQIYNDIWQQPASKVTTDGFCTGDEVGVYIVNYDGEIPGTLKLEDNQADNVRFKYNENGDWVSDFDVYYKDNDTKVDFYGYYPYADPSSIEAYPFEVARDQSKGPEHGQMAAYEASDFLWAKTSNVTPTASKVLLTFRHQMSSARVRFSQGTGWTDAAEYAAVTKEVLVANTIRKSTINLSTGLVTPEGEAPLTGIIPMNDNGEFRAIVVPQTVPAGKTLLTLTIDGMPRHYSRDEDTEYVPGKITTYDLSISKKANTSEYEIELTGISITAWEADNVSHGEDAREYVVVHNEIPRQLERTIVDRLGMDPAKIKNLKITGKITTADYTFMCTKMTQLQRLNLKEVESMVGDKYAIPSGAFYNKTTLMKCVLPDKLEVIERLAFANTSLSGTLLLPEGLTSISGFRGTKITNVQFPSTLRIIGVDAFCECKSLMCELSLPESLETIGTNAFASSAITGNLNLPENLDTIEESAFDGCGNLSGSLVIPRKITHIGERTFRNTGLNGTLTLPEGIVEIGELAFTYSKLRGELFLPESLTVIGRQAFSNTEFSGNIILPESLVSIGSAAFSGCWRLSGVVEFPQNITSVPTSLFSGCRVIEGVKLHKYIAAVEAEAFYGCTGIYSIVSEAKNPPAILSNSFYGVPKDNFTLEVPEASVTLYRNANNWREFKRIDAHRDFSVSRRLLRILNDEISQPYLLRAPVGENWSVESKPDWVEISPMNGVGKTDITVKVSELAKGAGKRSGEVVFLLDGKEYRSSMTIEQYDYEYGDGDVVTLQEASNGNGINVVIMGDCFDAKDISEGKYLKAMQDACGYFFDVEPYQTYKEYFNVYGVFGVSQDSGLGTVNTIRESRFGSQYYLTEGVDLNEETIFAAASLAPINDDISHTLVILLENSQEYGGRCLVWGDGSAIAVVPMSTDPAPYDFRGVVHHEAGGHGFGKLADEYIQHLGFVNACKICGDKTPEIITMQSYGFYDNISLDGNTRTVSWSHLIYDPQFANTVDVYEGAYYHARGVFRSEPISCMHNNIPYYNAISRESIVKRIKKYAGEEYSFEEFKANDKESLPSVVTKSVWQWSEDYIGTSSRFDQMPPKFMGEKPSFKKSDF